MLLNKIEEMFRLISAGDLQRRRVFISGGLDFESCHWVREETLVQQFFYSGGAGKARREKHL